jgi:hypothetical protein
MRPFQISFWAAVLLSVILVDCSSTQTSQVSGLLGSALNGASSAASASPGAAQPSGSATPVPTVTTSGAPNFGPNVLIVDPSMASSDIQSKLDAVAGFNEFDTHRYAVLFKPGTYNVNVNVGYYLQVMGLGATPDDVVINGAVQCRDGGSALVNFWRSVENLSVVPNGGTMIWAVSQASPLRRIHVKGSLALSDGGYTSGGFLADSVIDKQVSSGSQQQWMSRNSQWGSWNGANWNMVFVGDVNAPANAFPNPPDTTAAQTPLVREKPFLTIDSSGNYSVFVPAFRSASQGPSWSSGTAPGQSIPINRFYIAQAGTDTSTTMNAALAQGLNLILTPGIYTLTEPLQVGIANTVVLGLGMATLVPPPGMPAMAVGDVDGIQIGGLIFQAGTPSSPILLQVGLPGNATAHTSNPTSLYDVFARVGGAAAGSAAISVEINSNNVVGDNFWLWRADHGSSVGWTSNTANNGLVVNGSNVTIYGLAVEHYQQYQTLWNGNGGLVYFYQSEAPYDPPNQAAWMDGSTNGYASYKVADTVTSHQAFGLGVYCYFDVNPSVKLASAIEVPAAGLSGMFHDMTTVSLGGTGEITHILNTEGGTANGGASTQRLTQ